MTRFYCMQGCGCNYCTSGRSPFLPKQVGMGTGCPRCAQDHSVNTPTSTKVCRKCGLLNNISASKLSPKHNGGVYAIKCIDCNHPTITDQDMNPYIFYCIECGRVYHANYARKNSSGGQVIKCPKCGGSTSTTMFTTL